MRKQIHAFIVSSLHTCHSCLRTRPEMPLPQEMPHLADSQHSQVLFLVLCDNQPCRHDQHGPFICRCRRVVPARLYPRISIAICRCDLPGPDLYGALARGLICRPFRGRMKPRPPALLFCILRDQEPHARVCRHGGAACRESHRYNFNPLR